MWSLQTFPPARHFGAPTRLLLHVHGKMEVALAATGSGTPAHTAKVCNTQHCTEGVRARPSGEMHPGRRQWTALLLISGQQPPVTAYRPLPVRAAAPIAASDRARTSERGVRVPDRLEEILSVSRSNSHDMLRRRRLCWVLLQHLCSSARNPCRPTYGSRTSSTMIWSRLSPAVRLARRAAAAGLVM